MLVARRDSVKREADTGLINRVALAGSARVSWGLILPLALVTNVIIASIAWQLVGLLVR
jgi:hypothetical protein